MQDLSLHLLDMIENSVRAGADRIEVSIEADLSRNRIQFRINDNGSGMDAETLHRAQDPFYTSKGSRKKKIGLGIPLFHQNAEACGGRFSIDSKPGEGTRIEADFVFDHLDRMPLGNIGDTFLNSVIGHPEVDWLFELRRKGFSGEKQFVLDIREVRSELGDVPLTLPEVIVFLRETIYEGVQKTQMEEL